MKIDLNIGGLVGACALAMFGTLASAAAHAQDPAGTLAPPVAQPTAQQFPTQPYQGAAAASPQFQAQPGLQPGLQPVPPTATQAAPSAQQFPGQPSPPVAQQPQPVNPASAPMGVPPTQLPPLPPVQADIDRYTETYFGATPEQIRQLYKIVSESQRAVAQPGPPPKPVTGTISVSLSPGTTPPVIRTYMGNTSTFVVVDSTGAPWPVENFRVGNSTTFALSRLDAAQGSSFALDTKAPFATSNLVLKLSGVPTPVVINLVAGQKEMDARVEVRVQGRGPNAVTAAGVVLPKGVDARLLPVLNGIAPPGGKMLKINGLDGVRGWMMPSGRMVVRTPVKIISPASPTFISSADGTYVYEFMPTSQLMGLVDGQFVTLDVAGW